MRGVNSQTRLWLVSTLFCLFFPVLAAKESSAAAAESVPRFPSIALINNVAFQDSSFNNELAGCGFLIQVQGDTLACTCKHALFLAKSDVMRAVHFEGSLASWAMHPKGILEKTLQTKQLLNENRDEVLDAAILQKDWLVFSITNNNTGVEPLVLRDQPLVSGEILYLIGWSYENQDGPQRVLPYEYYKTVGNKILLREISAQGNLAGMSGGAVVDKNRHLVGIVSDFTADPDDGIEYLSPCSTSYLREVLAAAGYPVTQ